MFGDRNYKEEQFKATQIIRQATDDMLGSDPFFGHLMDQLRLAPDSKKDVTTIATNGRIMAYDSAWVNKAYETYGPSKFKGLLAHEAAHIAYGHPYRLGDKKPDVYDKACDAVVNGILRKRGYDLPDDSFFFPDAEKMTVEEVYRKLMEGQKGQDKDGQQKSNGQAAGKTFSPYEGTDEEEKNKANGQGQGEGQGQGQGEGEGEDGQDEEDQVRENVAKAAQKARKAGNMPGDYQKMIDQSFFSKKDWKDVLRLFLGGGELKQPSWSKPNRRYVYQGDYLPGNAKHGPGTVVLAIDVSGSIDARLLEKFLTEVRKINEDLQPDATYVLTCDTRIPWSERFGPYDDVEVPRSAITGGGTRFSPVFQWVEEQGISPKALIYFTDLECSDFGDKPDYETMWVVWPGGRGSAPWGQIIQMDD